MPPSEAGKFCIFANGIMLFGEYFKPQIRASDEYTKKKVLFGPD